MERKALQEDLIFHENVPRWFKAAFWVVEKILGKIYDLHTVMVSPDMHGIAMTRQRCFMFGVHKASMKLVRNVDLAMLQHTFLRQVRMSPSTFFMAPAEVVAQAEKELRAKEGLENDVPITLQTWMSTGSICRAVEHVQNDIAKHKFQTHEYKWTNRIIDPRQSEVARQIGPLLGSLQRGSAPISLDHGRPLLPEECLSAMGLNMFPNVQSRWVTPVASIIAAHKSRSRCDDSHIRSMAGNTTHGANVFAVLLSVRASCRKVEPRFSLRTLPTFGSDFEAEHDSDME